MDTPTQLQDNDGTTAVLTKVLIAVLSGPKLSALASSIGIQIDPTLLSVAISGILHKLHLFVKAETGWSWL